MEADGGSVFGAPAAGHCFTRPRRPAAAWCQGSPAPHVIHYIITNMELSSLLSSVNQDKPISLKHIYKIIQFKKYSWRLHTVSSRRDIFGRFSKQSCCLPLVSILNYMVNVSRPLDTALDRRGYLVICCGAHECCCCPHCKQVAVVLLCCCGADIELRFRKSPAAAAVSACTPTSCPYQLLVWIRTHRSQCSSE